jgi:NADP-dependent 3-hydroxy acid dehydrogenase YdfG
MIDWVPSTSRAGRRFEGQTAVITGGGTGVGAAVSIALASLGASIYLIGRRLNRLELVAARARKLGADAACCAADISLSSGLIELTHRMNTDLKRIDILIQSAAVYAAGAIEGADLSDFDKLYQTNVRAPYALTQVLLPMLKAQQGQVVFINSSSALTAKPTTAQYDSTKHALKALADSLRGEINRDGVRVLSVYLGRTASEMQEQICQMEGKPYRPEILLQPTDVASVILNALSLPRSAEVTDVWIRPMIKSQ